jgi:nucleoredoxin
MKTSAGLLLLVVVLAAGIFYLRARNPVAFARVQTDVVALFASPPSDDSSTSMVATGPNPIAAKMAAPAVNAAARLANTASQVMSPPSVPKPPAVPVVSPDASTPASPAPIQTPAPSVVQAPPPVPVVAPSSTPPSPLLPTQTDNSANIISESSAATSEASSASVASAPLTTWTPPAKIPAQPNWTWTTTDGTTYKNVKIISVDPENVTILHEDGGAQVPISTLTPDLQKLLNYDPKAAASWTMGHLVSGNLVALKNGAMQPVDDSVIRPVKYFAVYYSASWCPPCHKFTPDLVKFYNDFKPSHPDFELIFVSEDTNAASMLGYMKEMSMPWLAANYDTLTHPHGSGTFKAPGIENFAGNGIPDLVLVDATGKVLSDSFQNGQYVGPDKVVTDIKAMVQ